MLSNQVDYSNTTHAICLNRIWKLDTDRDVYRRFYWQTPHGVAACAQAASAGPNWIGLGDRAQLPDAADDVPVPELRGLHSYKCTASQAMLQRHLMLRP